MVSIRSLTPAILSHRPQRLAGWQAMASVMWFRRDLRLADNPALVAAARRRPGAPALRARPGAVGSGRPEPARLPRRLAAGARRRACASAAARLASSEGDPVRAGGRAPPGGRRRAGARRGRLRPVRPRAATPPSSGRWPSTGSSWSAPGSPYAVTPGRVTTGAGEPYQVFTPYHRAWAEHGWRGPVDAPADVDWLELGEHRRRPGPGAARRPDAARGRRGRGPAPLGRLPRPGRDVRRGPRPARRRRHLADVGAPEVGRGPPAHAARRPRPAAQRRRGDVPQGAGLAGVLRRRARRPAGDRPRLPAARVRPDAVRRAGRPARRPGRRAAPASRSSTPGCASCARPAGCTTGSG